ncbi:MAG: hypothetical protein IPI68_09850 [Chitinophagaceae bacterium]|nr:hypothetical protein [Chitinophagaceae bacterium]
MKRIFLSAIVMLICLPIFAQVNYSGSYGYKLPGDSHPKDKTAIPGGTLVLIKMDGSKYRFWLDVLNGPPGWNRGETDGTITFANDTAAFDNTFEDATNPCILKFKITNNTITINSESTSFNCGFGNGVNADGDYPRLEVQPLLNNKWLKKEYQGLPTAVITAGKAEVFQDENCMISFTKKQYFVKGDSLISVTENKNTFYTEFISPAGKFIYGWIKKSAVKITQTE